MNFLDQIPIVSTVRRNHGVEHATIHVLASRLQNLSLVGHATLDGFNLYGEVEADQVEFAANEALRRLRAGDSRLVIHPNCGTNFATAGMLAGIAAWLPAARYRQKIILRFGCSPLPAHCGTARHSSLRAHSLPKI